MENLLDRIASNPAVMLGKPTIKGTRITIEVILRKLSEGASPAQMLEMYPALAQEDIQAALQYAAYLVGNERFVFPAA